MDDVFFLFDYSFCVLQPLFEILVFVILVLYFYRVETRELALFRVEIQPIFNFPGESFFK